MEQGGMLQHFDGNLRNQGQNRPLVLKNPIFVSSVFLIRLGIQDDSQGGEE
jgi:hypothetical protein